MNKNTLFAHTTTGYKHIQMDLANEDSVDLWQNDPYQIIAIADGHGARECFRSEVGSSLAVDVAIQNLKLFAQTVDKYDLDHVLQNEEDREALIRSLIQDIVDNWNQYVYADIQAFPIREEEYQRAQTLSSIYQKGMYLTNIYGTTLLSALITENYILILQQGDGVCICVDQNGFLYQPMPDDALCIRNITTSLCDKDASRRMRYVWIDRRQADTVAIMIASDGIDKSFQDLIHLQAFFGELCLEIKDLDQEKIQSYFAHLLPEISKRGSKDDTSLAGWIDPSKIEAVKKELEHYVQVAHNMDRLKSAENRLHHEKNAKKHFDMEKGKLESRVQKIEKEIEALQEEKIELRKNLDALEMLHSKQVNACKDAQHSLDEANGRFVRSLMSLEEQKKEEQ